MPNRISILRGTPGIGEIDWKVVLGQAVEIGENIITEVVKNKNKNSQGSGTMPQQLFEDWYAAQVKNYAGRFSEVTRIWPVPANLIPASWIADQVRAHNYHTGYETLQKVVANKGKSDGMAFINDDNGGGGGNISDSTGPLFALALGLGLFYIVK